MTFSNIAEKLAVSPFTVRLCISKYYEGGVENALFDTQRPGRPSEITDDAKAWMINIACQRPVELGYAQELWTLNSLHKHIQKHAEEAGYHQNHPGQPFSAHFQRDTAISGYNAKGTV